MLFWSIFLKDSKFLKFLKIPLLINIFATLSLDPRLEQAIMIFLFFLVKSRISLLRFS